MCSSCSVEEETVYRINASRFQSQSQIAIDSTQIFRNSRNNTLNVEVRYQAKTYNAAYDSIKWEFPGGTPNNVSDVKETSVIYNKYGTYNAKMILLKYDTLNYGNIRLLVDTIPITENLDIKYKNAGLSRQKISYINGIIFNQDLKKTTRRKLKSLSSEEYFNLLISIKGIGPWSIEMSRIFFIGDPDIFSILDLGLKNAHLKLFSLKNYNQDFYYQFSPYRSYMCLFLWRVLEDENVTI